MKYNILNGDALAYSFPESEIEGAIIVCREALIDGDVSGNDLPSFWQARAKYLGVAENDYHDKVVSQFEQVLQAPDGSTFNLWFEYDLFCQVNMWFVLSLLHGLSIRKKVYAVYTSYVDRDSKHFWNGYGPATSPQLQVCYADRILLSDVDGQLGHDLWAAYKDNNLDALSRLASHPTDAFPYLQEVVQAHIDRFPHDGTAGRPESVIADILQQGTTDFPGVFQEFWKRESIYGFGDTQLKSIYDMVMRGQ
ncbi:hypothetical protein [Paraflavitalea pollutisoli]|uniref:hypothetical protein n=1 Tax=Paraflavitalea pollutisoli TaxID=3034143 RepID=UPI0023EC7C34|nr:hypothetical protein [Paraflavitalea sp. H1-2-19X]